MAKKNSKLLSEDQIRQIIKNKYAPVVVDDILDISDYAIAEFYDDYPRGGRKMKYKRKYGLLNMYRHEVKDTPDGIVVEFVYSFRYITSHKMPSVIFYGPFMQGYHGGPRISNNVVEGSFSKIKSKKQYGPAPQMSPSPWDIIADYAKTYSI